MIRDRLRKYDDAVKERGRGRMEIDPGPHHKPLIWKGGRLMTNIISRRIMAHWQQDNLPPAGSLQ